MKNTKLQLPEMKADSSASSLFIARQVIKTISSDIKSALAIIAPEADAIRADASNHTGSVEAVIRNFMRKPANSATQLYKAIRSLQELQTKLGANLGPLEELGNARSLAMKTCAVALCEAAMSAAEDALQPWYDPTMLPRCARMTVQVQRAQAFFDKYANLSFGADIVRVADPDRFTYDAPNNNQAGTVFSLSEAQDRTWEAAQREYAELVKMIQ